jgi:pyruvate dehydrogenase E2 component (dihydrolipoamide acetyltransferase)
MATPVEAPKLGNTVEECLVAKWVKRKGDPLSAGETVVEIETDKATFEVTAPVSGVLLETFFAEGALAPVFTNLFVIGEPGESVEPFRPNAAKPASEPVPAEPEAQWGGPPGLPSSQALRSPVVSPVLQASFSPRARRFAEEHRFYPSAVAGSGPGGRVLEDDLRQLYYSQPPRVLSAAIVPAPQRQPAPASGIREKIARRMRESLATTAQYTLHSSADASGLLALRKRAKAAAADITIGDLAAFCAVQALLEFPALNAEWIGGHIRDHTEIHLGFACDTPRGLMAPVVRNADKLTLSDLAVAMHELAAQATAGTISVDSLSGATFTVSNLGGLGIESFTP